MNTIEKFLNKVWASDELDTNMGAWNHINEFADRYDSTEFHCIQDYSTCIAILQSMDYEQEEIDEVLGWFEERNGCCDCEVGMMVLPRYCYGWRNNKTKVADRASIQRLLDNDLPGTSQSDDEEYVIPLLERLLDLGVIQMCQECQCVYFYTIAKMIAGLPEFKDNAVIGCSGNGHYVVASLVPILVYGQDMARQYKCFCQSLIHQILSQLPDSVRIDPVYNLSRVMRVMGTLNRKGIPTMDRPHRRSYFVTEIPKLRSMALHHRIVNTEIEPSRNIPPLEYKTLRCNLKHIEQCQFIQWCRKYPQRVSEPHWFGLITNLARLKGGCELIHEISQLDVQRYDYANTERIIKRVVENNYQPVNCLNLKQILSRSEIYNSFTCSVIDSCPARAPMYMTAMYVDSI